MAVDQQRNDVLRQRTGNRSRRLRIDGGHPEVDRKGDDRQRNDDRTLPATAAQDHEHEQRYRGNQIPRADAEAALPAVERRIDNEKYYEHEHDRGELEAIASFDKPVDRAA